MDLPHQFPVFIAQYYTEIYFQLEWLQHHEPSDHLFLKVSDPFFVPESLSLRSLLVYVSFGGRGVMLTPILGMNSFYMASINFRHYSFGILFTSRNYFVYAQKFFLKDIHKLRRSKQLSSRFSIHSLVANSTQTPPGSFMLGKLSPLCQFFTPYYTFIGSISHRWLSRTLSLTYFLGIILETVSL